MVEDDDPPPPPPRDGDHDDSGPDTDDDSGSEESFRYSGDDSIDSSAERESFEAHLRTLPTPARNRRRTVFAALARRFDRALARAMAAATERFLPTRLQRLPTPARATGTSIPTSRHGAGAAVWARSL